MGLIELGVRKAWLYLTGEDPVTVSGTATMLARLNELHCEFLEELVRKHPELKDEVNAHQDERAKLCCG